MEEGGDAGSQITISNGGGEGKSDIYFKFGVHSYHTLHINNSNNSCLVPVFLLILVIYVFSFVS